MLLYIAYIIVFIAFGSAVNLQYFRKTNYGEMNYIQIAAGLKDRRYMYSWLSLTKNYS